MAQRDNGRLYKNIKGSAINVECYLGSGNGHKTSKGRNR